MNHILSPALHKDLITAQRNDISEHRTYTLLARRTRDRGNADVLQNIAHDELEHYNF